MSSRNSRRRPFNPSGTNQIGNLILMSKIKLLNQAHVPIEVAPLAQTNGGEQPPLKIATPGTEPKETKPFDTPVDPVIWEMSLKNRDYYLGCSKADNNAKPWFQYPKFSYQYSEFVFVEPEMARALLRFNPENRKLGMPSVEAYKRDNENNMWLQTHESLAIDTNGNMFDGQHRAMMIVESNKGWPLYITWNVPPAARFVVDSGKKRSTDEKLSLVVNNRLKRMSSMCRAMMRGINQISIKHSDSEIGAFAVKYQETLEWVGDALPNARADVQAVIGKARLRWPEKTERILQFCERFRGTVLISATDPVRALYVWLEANKGAKGLVVYKKAISAVVAHIEDRQLEKLYEASNDIFEWETGWAIPEATD